MQRKSKCFFFQKGKFTSYQGIDGFLLANVTAGMSPATSLLEVITQVGTLLQLT